MTDFERVLVDQMREIRDELRDQREQIADLREAVARLESETTERGAHRPRRFHAVRDGGMTISAATLGGGLLWLIQHLVAK